MEYHVHFQDLGGLTLPVGVFSTESEAQAFIDEQVKRGEYWIEEVKKK